ncbi:MAG: hypothetical protein WDA42_05440 [Candidatus Bathyarchaeia archaeon]
MPIDVLLASIVLDAFGTDAMALCGMFHWNFQSVFLAIVFEDIIV